MSTSPLDYFEVFIGPRGLCISNPPLPHRPITPVQAATLAAQLVHASERSPWQFDNMLLAVNDSHVVMHGEHDVNGIYPITVLRPPAPAAPLEHGRAMRLAFWLNHYAKRPDVFRNVKASLES